MSGILLLVAAAIRTNQRPTFEEGDDRPVLDLHDHEMHGLQVVMYFSIIIVHLVSDNIDRIIPACAWS